MVKAHDELGNSRIRIKVPGLDSNEYSIQWSNGDTDPVASLNAGWHWCDVVVNNYCTLRDSFFIEWQCDEPVLLESPSDRDENYFASLCGFWKTEREDYYRTDLATCVFRRLITVINRPIDSVYSIQWSPPNNILFYEIQIKLQNGVDSIIEINGNKNKYRFESFGDLRNGKVRVRPVVSQGTGVIDTLSWSCWQIMNYSFPFDYNWPITSVSSCIWPYNKGNIYNDKTKFLIRQFLPNNCNGLDYGPFELVNWPISGHFPYEVIECRLIEETRYSFPYKYQPLVHCAPDYACRSGCIQYDLEKGDFELFNNEVSGLYSGARSEGEWEEVLPATKNFRCSLFPNPASDYLVLQASETMKYSIFSTNGTVLTQGRLEAGEIRLNLEGMAKGFYVFLAFTEEGESQRIFFQIR